MPSVRRGQVAVESLIGLVGVTVVTAASTLLLVFASVRTARLAASATVQLDGELAVADIERTVGRASRMSVSGNSLALLIPETSPNLPLGIQRFSFPAPDAISNGRETHSTTSGTIVWYYVSDTTGNFATPGVFLWRAVRTGASWPAGTAFPTPTLAERDLAWSWNSRTGAPRWPRLSAFFPTRLGGMLDSDSVWLRIDFNSMSSRDLIESLDAAPTEWRRARYRIERTMGQPLY